MAYKLEGHRFGRLLVVSKLGSNKHREILWKCICDCGNEKIATSKALVSGTTKSCGCLRKDVSRKSTNLSTKFGSDNNMFRHGMSKSRLYNIWCGMKARCGNNHSPAYIYYGGRGITICYEWLHSFEAFRAWALSHGYRDDLTIDRVDNDGNYEPDNCRWVTMEEQNKNKRAKNGYKIMEEHNNGGKEYHSGCTE